MAGQLGMKMGASGNLQKPSGSDSSHQDQPEWLIHEDWSLLQVSNICHLLIHIEQKVDVAAMRIEKQWCVL